MKVDLEKSAFFYSFRTTLKINIMINKLLTVLTANASAYAMTLVSTASPIIALAVSLASLFWIFYKMKNERFDYLKKLEDEKNQKSTKKN